MARSTLARRLAVTAAVVAGTTVGPLVQLAGAGPTAPDVPGDIDVQTGHKPFLVGHAVGVQIYTCNPVTGGYAWSSATPRADLYDDHGKVIVRHFGGPSWEAKDGSKVVGQRLSGVPAEDPTHDIPWLLLEATGAPGPDGDRLAGTTFIQRINTAGGVTPAASACTAGTVGAVEEVAYTADYWFWKKSGS